MNVSDILSSNRLINLDKIKSLKTKNFLKKFCILDEKDLVRMMPVCYLEGVSEDFNQHVKSYELNATVEKLWKAYTQIPPRVSWCGRKLCFSFSYNQSTKKFHYPNDHYDGLKESQLIFIEVRFLFGLIKLAVTHQVNKISEKAKTIKLCYMEGGASSGSQILSFERISDDKTRVTHRTYYKSNSNFRDKYLYPFLHERIINQFHQNVFRYMEVN